MRCVVRACIVSPDFGYQRAQEHAYASLDHPSCITALCISFLLFLLQFTVSGRGIKYFVVSLSMDLAGDLHVGDLHQRSPYRATDGQHQDLPFASQAEADGGELYRSPTMKTMGDDLEVRKCTSLGCLATISVRLKISGEASPCT